MTAPLSKVVKLLEKAKNDSEKFAALLVLTKSINSEKLVDEEKKKIFKSIGFTFPLRLISTTEKDDSNLLTGLGLSIFATFCPVKDLVTEDDMEDIVEKIMGILDCQLDNSALQHVIEIMMSYQQIAHDSILYEAASIKAISQVIINVEDDDIQLGFIKIITHLLSKRADLWQKCKDDLMSLFEHISVVLQSRKDKYKFLLLEHLSVLLSVFDDSLHEMYFGRWLDNMKLCLYEIFTSRLSPVERNPTLQVCSHLIRCFGLGKILTKTEKCDKFHLLLVRLICIEISLILRKTESINDADELEKILNDSGNCEVLVSCFYIYEACCTSIADFDHTDDDDSGCEDLFTFADIQVVENSLTEVAKLIGELVQQSLECGAWEQPIVLACFRAIASWLNVEYFAAKETGKEFAPTFVAFVKKLPLEGDDDLVKVISTVVMVYCQIDSAITLFRKENMFEFLCLKLCTNSRGLGREAYQLLCQTLMALVLNLVDVDVSRKEIVTSLLAECEYQRKNFVAYFHVSTLTCLVLNKLKQMIQARGCVQFFHSLTSFLQMIHTTDGKSVRVATRYEEEWSEVEELWPIIMKELTAATQSKLVDITTLKSSGFLHKIQDLNKIFISQQQGLADDVQYHYKMLCDSFIQLDI